MKPDARNLSVNMRGDDVKLLQKRLSKLGFSIEDKDGFFGKTTRRAVLDIQKKHGMKASGIVDEATVEVINVDAPDQQRFTVHGRVMRSDGAALAGVAVGVADWDRAGVDSPGTTWTERDGRYDILSRTSATYDPGQPAAGHGSDELMQFMNLEM